MDYLKNLKISRQESNENNGSVGKLGKESRLAEEEQSVIEFEEDWQDFGSNLKRK